MLNSFFLINLQQAKESNLQQSMIYTVLSANVFINSKQKLSPKFETFSDNRQRLVSFSFPRMEFHVLRLFLAVINYATGFVLREVTP